MQKVCRKTLPLWRRTCAGEGSVRLFLRNNNMNGVPCISGKNGAGFSVRIAAGEMGCLDPERRCCPQDKIHLADVLFDAKNLPRYT
jgi:hypothetical protein